MWEATLRVCLPDSGQAGQENISWQRVSRLQPVLVTSFPVSQIRTVIQRRSRPGSRLSSKHSWNARKPPVRVHSLRKSFAALRYFGDGTHIVTCRRQVTIRLPGYYRRVVGNWESLCPSSHNNWEVSDMTEVTRVSTLSVSPHMSSPTRAFYTWAGQWRQTELINSQMYLPQHCDIGPVQVFCPSHGKYWLLL